ncbi:hypothetical protein [Limosilactobacillus reuteri]|uniref:hypothetical protein n=1 Tax=Limosilactobacillus reuteri TaxID=1598 RepID=UPI00398CE0F9
MATIYYADETTKFFKGTNIVDGEYQLKDNETFENPTGKLEPAKLVNGSWIDATSEEHEAYVKAQQKSPITVTPSASEKGLNVLGTQVAKLTKDNLALTQLVNTLGQQVASMQKNNKENGGN